MTDHRQADTTVHEEQREQMRLALRALAVPVVFVIMFALCIIRTYHEPHPNGTEVAVVGPASQTDTLSAQIENEAGSAFDIRQVETVAEAERAVRQRDLDAAFVPTADPERPATVIVASAGGRLVATAAEVLARTVTSTQGAQLAVHDVRPLTSGDELGLGVFVFIIVCTICGYLAATLLFSFAPALLPDRRYALFAALRSWCRRSPT